MQISRAIDVVSHVQTNSGILQGRKANHTAAPMSAALPASTWLILAVLGDAAIVIFAIAQENWPLALGGFFLPLLFVYPIEISLGLFAFLLPFDTLSSTGADSSAGSSVGWYSGALVGLVLLATGIMGKRFRRPPRAAFWWGLFVLWNVASLLWALNPKQGLERLPSAICLFLLYLAIVSFKFRERELYFVLVLACLGAVVTAGLAVSDFVHGASPRASLVVGDRESNPNDFASSLLLALSISLSMFLAIKSRWKRMAALSAALLIALGIFLTMSRGSLFALAALLVVYLARVGVRRRVLLWLVLLPMLTLLLPHQFFTRIEHGMNDRATGRVDIWVVAGQIIKHYPVAGAGLENFRTAYNQFAGFAPVFRRFDRDPHNIYLQVWSETGIVGLLLLLAAIVSQLKSARKYFKHQSTPDLRLVAIEATCWALLTHGLAANLLWRKYFWMSWALLAVLIASYSGTKSSSLGHEASIGISD